MARPNSAKGKLSSLIGKITNVGLIFLGFVSVFFVSQAKDNAANTHEDIYGTNIAHADGPVSSYSGGGGGGGGGSYSGGSGSGGCGAGGSGSSGGDGGGASGCGCGSY